VRLAKHRVLKTPGQHNYSPLKGLVNAGLFFFLSTPYTDLLEDIMSKLQNEYDAVRKHFRRFQEEANNLLESGEASDEDALRHDIGVMICAEEGITDTMKCAIGGGGSSCPPIC